MTPAWTWQTLAAYGPELALGAPFVGAVLAALAPGPRWALLCAWVAVLAAALGAAATAWIVPDLADARLLTQGVALRVDAWSAASALLLAAGAPLALLLGGPGLIDAAGPPARFGFSMVLVLFGSAMGLVFSADFASLAVFLQLAAIALAAATALGGRERPAALSAALRAALALGLAGAFAWFAAALALADSGAVDAVITHGPDHKLSRALAAAFALACIAAATAGLLAPFNQWSSALFGAAPVAVGLLVLAALAPAALSALGRFSAALTGSETGVVGGAMLVALGAASAVIGSIQALAAKDVRRLAAYGFASHAGCAMIGLALGAPAAAGAAWLHVCAAAAGALLLAASGGRVGVIAQMDGAGKVAPLAALAAALGCFVFMGAPFTLGFASTWLLLEAMLAAGWWAGAALVVSASLAAVAFGGRLLERLYFRSPDAAAGAAGAWEGAGLALAIAAVAAAGLAGDAMADLAKAAGAALLAPAPGAAP